MNAKYFVKRPDHISFLVVMGHLFLTVLPIYVAAYSKLGWITVVCWIFFGGAANGIANLMHECCHYHVFKRKKGSEILGRYLVAPLMVADFESYRDRHWAHHKHLGVEGETKDAYLIDIHGKNLFLLLIRSFFMLEMFKKFAKQINLGTAQDEVHKDYHWVRATVLFQTIFFATILLTAYVGHPVWRDALIHGSLIYAFVYCYGLISLTVFMADLRAIAEHQLNAEQGAQEGYAALRNFRCNLFERFFFGAYGFGEHYTHHKVPGIPYYHLKEATEDISCKDNTLKPATGYLGTLKQLTQYRESIVINPGNEFLEQGHRPRDSRPEKRVV
jgi:Fatty acid desaturase